MIMMIFAAALPLRPRLLRSSRRHARRTFPARRCGQPQGNGLRKHMKADKTADCCKDMPDAEKAKCCAERAAGHAEHHKK